MILHWLCLIGSLPRSWRQSPWKLSSKLAGPAALWVWRCLQCQFDIPAWFWEFNSSLVRLICWSRFYICWAAVNHLQIGGLHFVWLNIAYLDVDHHVHSRLPYVPKNGWFVVENPIEMDDLGATPFLGNLHICGYHLFLGHPNWYGFMLCWKSGGNDPNQHATQELNPLYSGWFRQWSASFSCATLLVSAYESL